MDQKPHMTPLVYINVAEGMVRGNIHHFSESNVCLLPGYLCSSQLRNAHHFIPALLLDHDVPLGTKLLVTHIHSN